MFGSGSMKDSSFIARLKYLISLMWCSDIISTLDASNSLEKIDK